MRKYTVVTAVTGWTWVSPFMARPTARVYTSVLLALTGAGGLAVLWWLKRKDKLL